MKIILTGIRFFDPEMDDIQKFIAEINNNVKELTEGNIETAIKGNSLNLNWALLYDAVILYTSAIKAMGLEEGGNITCEAGEAWNFGSSIINFIRTVSVI